MVAAAGTDLEILLQIKRVNHGLALWAFDPEVIWHVFFLVDAKFWSFEDTHDRKSVMVSGVT